MRSSCIIEELLYLSMHRADLMCGSCRAGVVDAVSCMTHGGFMRDWSIWYVPLCIVVCMMIGCYMYGIDKVFLYYIQTMSGGCIVQG
jgi:hypothetical protein